jgi:hypothetical protein
MHLFTLLVWFACWWRLPSPVMTTLSPNRSHARALLGNALSPCTGGTEINTQYDVSVGDMYTFACPPPLWMCYLILGVPDSYYNIYSVKISCCNRAGTITFTSDVAYSGGYGYYPPKSSYAYNLPNPFSSLSWTWAGFAVPGLTVGDLSENRGFNNLYYDRVRYDTICPANKYITGIYGWYGEYISQALGMCNYLCRPCAAGQYSLTGGTCTVCPAGYYSGAGAYYCIQCSPGAPAGSYFTSTLSCAVVNCAAGTYSSGGYVSVCSTCALTTYCPTGASTAAPCPAGSYCPSSSVRNTCTAGAYCPSGSVAATLLCTSGSYCPAGSAASTPCAAGSYCSTPSTQTLCPAGSYCPASTVSPIACTLSYYCPPGTSSLVLCAAGSYCSTPSSSQILCPNGTYCVRGSVSPTPCALGSFAGSMGLSQCTLCAAGSFGGSTGLSVCTLCAAGVTSLAGSSVCDISATGAPLNAHYTTGSNWVCNIGYYKTSSTTCSKCLDSSACPLGTYRPPCTDGLTNTQTCSGSCTRNQLYTPINNDIFFWLSPSKDNTAYGCEWGCPQGYYKNAQYNGCYCCATVTTPQEYTNFWNSFGNYLSSMEACPYYNCQSGFYPQGVCYDVWGVNSYSSQPYCAPCVDVGSGGVFTSAGVTNQPTSCTFECTSGYFASGYACVQWKATCPLGSSWSAGTSTSDATCTQCASQANVVYNVLNSCTFTCVLGYEKGANGLCQPCALGMYRNNLSWTACVACPAGTFSSNTGTKECTLLPANSVCNAQATDFICNAGYARATDPIAGGTAYCAPCVLGLYSSSSGATLCLSCSPGNYNSLGTASVSCTPCPTGTYADVYGSTACKTWTALCPLGNAWAAGTSTGNSTCTPCAYPPYNIYVYSVNSCSYVCIAGYQITSGCTACPVGTYKSAATNTLCLSCMSGQYQSGTVGTVCLLCSSGTFGSTTGLGVCAACGPGLYVGTTGATAPAPCSVGKYSTGLGTVACASCAAGATSGRGTTFCYPVGTKAAFWYQLSGVLQCSAGAYSTSPAFTACVSCSAGFFSTAIGALDTLEWGTGTYTFSSVQSAVADCQLPRLDAEGGWCPATISGAWSQLDLGAPSIVKGLITQGRATASEWVTKLALTYSQDAAVWSSPAMSLGGNSDSYTRLSSFFAASFTARYIRVAPQTYNQWPSLRWGVLVQTTVCSTCPAGQYSASTTVSTCTACAAPPANAYFTSGCTYLCNVGFYLTSPTCSRCKGSSDCAAGQYRPNCTDGLTNTQGCTGLCTNKAQNSQAIYLGPSTDNSGNSCPWGCNAGYFLDKSIMSCTLCLTVCAVGYYPSFACSQVSSTPISPGPTCVQCTVPLNSAATSAGSPGVPTSCTFTCNWGFYGATCASWTLVCNAGYAWSAGTPTTNAVCTPCANAGNSAYFYYVQNKCDYTCSVGWELLVSGVCQMCAAGKAKNSALAVPCAPCPSLTYQNSPQQAECIPAPVNSLPNAGSTDFVCNAGFTRAEDVLLGGAYCKSCPGYPLLNSMTAQWSGCMLTTLACNSGFFRDWTVPGCQACPALPANSVQTAFDVSAFCASCNTTSPLQDEIVGCPFACNAGYYASGYACVRCATVSCSGGLYAQLCTAGSTSDVCKTCAYQLSTSQAWVAQCQWQCVAGYWMTAEACSACAPGKYKPLAGNQSCLDCAAGSYAASVLSCVACPSGTYNAVLSASACTLCAAGTVALQTGATVCSPCPVTWPNSFAVGGQSCQACPIQTPQCTDGQNCNLASPPCPAGYYLPYQGSACLLCPSGTYCVMGQQPAFCTGSSSALPSISVLNCTTTVGALPVSSCPANTAGTYQCVPQAGFYGPSGVAVQCPYDTYCPAGSLVPIACPPQMFAPLQSLSLSYCTTFMALPCRPSYYYPNATAPYCLGCPVGCYCPGQGLIFACDPSTNFSSAVLSNSSAQCQPGASEAGACPPNTNVPVLPLINKLQCRANAGYYALPGSSTATICPSAFYCPAGSVVPLLCPSPPASCPALGQYPTPSVCPLQGMALPTAVCQNCTPLPTNAYWSSSVDPACPFCCLPQFYRYLRGCNPQPTSSSCAVGQYIPSTPACALAVQPCLNCTAPTPPLDFMNSTARALLCAVSSSCSCVGCAAGYSLLNGNCVACSPGFFKSWVGNDTACLPCAEGTIAPLSAAAVCSPCPAYSSSVQSIQCICMAGLFMQAGVCVPCPAGSTSAAGSTVCNQCSAGSVWASR